MNDPTRKFRKLVAIEATRLLPGWDAQLGELADEAIFFDDIPQTSAEVAERIGDADGALLSYTAQIDGEVLRACPNLRYVGMCCSLYAPESANVDILTAQELGIVVSGARDYGDIGVKEYVIHALVGLLQGRGGQMWREEPMELTNLKIGVVGMGTLGELIARTLRFFDASLSYYSRTRKPAVEDELSCNYLPLHELLGEVDIVISCLNKNVILFGADEFAAFGPRKIFMNVSIAPSHQIPALQDWLGLPGTYALSDSLAALGGPEIAELPNVSAGTRSAGLTFLAKQRLGEIVVENAKRFLTD